jgi:hypothetical protein
VQCRVTGRRIATKILCKCTLVARGGKCFAFDYPLKSRALVIGRAEHAVLQIRRR